MKVNGRLVVWFKSFAESAKNPFITVDYKDFLARLERATATRELNPQAAYNLLPPSFHFPQVTINAPLLSIFILERSQGHNSDQ